MTRRIRITVIGDPKSGRSSLFSRITQNEFPAPKNKIFFHSCTLEKCKIDLVETDDTNFAGKYLGSVLLVIDLTKSDDEIRKRLDHYQKALSYSPYRLVSPNRLVYIAGTKLDLVEGDQFERLDRLARGQFFPQYIGCCVTSAKNGAGCDIPLAETVNVLRKIGVVNAESSSRKATIGKVFTVWDFAAAYRKQYKLETFKNPNSIMKTLLDNESTVKALTLESIFQYARKNGGRTAKVLRNLGIDFSKQDSNSASEPTLLQV